MLRRHLVADGWNDRAIAGMLTSGRWVRMRRGAYVDRSAWQALDPAGRHEVRTRAVLMQANADLVVSHTSGLPLYDAPTWNIDLSTVQVTRRDGRAGRAEAGIRQHRGLVLDADVVTVHGVQVMAPARLCLEVTMLASTEAALAVVNHFLYTGMTTLEALRRRYELGIEHWRDTLRTGLVLQLANPRIASVGESRVLYLCRIFGLPAPEVQCEIRDPSGNLVAIVDFAWPELGVFVEFDGLVKYGALLKPGQSASEVVVREKRREDLIRELTGWRCLRLVWADLARPEETAARLGGFLFAGTPVAS
jgi:hypothetical protein